MPPGYLHPAYPASLVDVGTPMFLPASGTWILARQIPGGSALDGMGCYPLLCCENWRGLGTDIDALASSLISLVAVADPLGRHSHELLRSVFDTVAPFKEHFVVETGRPLAQFVSPSHRAHARRALKSVTVERCPDPAALLDEWERLYAVLIARRSIQGLQRFSRRSFAQQLAVPGMVMFRAACGGQTVGLDLWYEQGDCAQGHLAAFDATGYELRASYATKWQAIEYFSDRVRWINLGGTPARSTGGGLAHFKRGWSTGSKMAWLCGRVLQRDAYAHAVRARGVAGTRYFPQYRHGELA